MNGPERREKGNFPVREGTVLGFLLLAAAILRFHRLNAQLWIDEVSALTGNIRRSALEIATTWPGTTSHVLYELLAHFSWSALGESPFAIRLPAALFGVAGVWAMHRFVRAFLPPRYALGAAALLAFSYIHVFQSQNARGYTALIFFFLLASSELIRFHRSGVVTRKGGTTYLVGGVLAGYSQLFGVVVMPAHLALAVAWWAVHRRWASFAAGRPGFPVRQFLPWSVVGIVATGLLYLPFVRSILRFSVERAGSPGEGPQLGLGLLRETLEGFSAALGGPIVLLAAGLVGALGMALWWRRDSFSLLLIATPISVQAVVFGALGAGVHPRYFAVALPAVYVVGTLGLFAVLDTLLGSLMFRSFKARPVAAGAFALVVALSALPLRDYYRWPKQDFLGALHYVERSASPEDQMVGIASAGRVLADFYGADLLTVDGLEELQALEERGPTLWILVTLEGLVQAATPDLMSHVRQGYERVAVFPGTVGDGAVRVYRRGQATDG